MSAHKKLLVQREIESMRYWWRTQVGETFEYVIARDGWDKTSARCWTFMLKQPERVEQGEIDRRLKEDLDTLDVQQVEQLCSRARFLFREATRRAMMQAATER